MDYEARCSSDCEVCVHGSVGEDKNKLLKCYCAVKEKYYVFGCYVSCSDYKKDPEKAKEVEEAKKERERKKNEKNKRTSANA